MPELRAGEKKMNNWFNKLFNLDPFWIRDPDLVGHKPTRTIRCKLCRPFWRPLGYRMILRNSKVMISKRQEGEKEYKCHINRLNYKCPNCDNVIGFFWPDEAEYIKEVFKRRGDFDIYYPGIAKWSAEDKQVAERLKALGYF